MRVGSGTRSGATVELCLERATVHNGRENDDQEEDGAGYRQRAKADSDLDVSRRGFIGGAAVGGLTAAGLGFNIASSNKAQAGGDGWSRRRDWDRDCPRGGGHKDRILLKGGVVLTLDPAVGDFEKADVLIEGKKIVSIRPNISASSAKVRRLPRHDRDAGLHQHA